MAQVRPNSCIEPVWGLRTPCAVMLSPPHPDISTLFSEITTLQARIYLVLQ